MASLKFRHGDPQALKAIIVEPSLKLQPSDSECEMILQLSNGTKIKDSNAMAEALGTLSMDAFESYGRIFEWMEWEYSILRPVVYTLNSQEKLQEPLKVLETALKNGKTKFLLENDPTLADIVVFSSLFHLRDDPILPEAIATYLSSLATLKSCQEAIPKMLGTYDASICKKRIIEDAQRLEEQKPKRPIPGERNILITSALPYVNNVPHLGNIIGCVLSADCYARFCRARGYNTIYICGTDEYGTATETKAFEENVSCEEICDKYHEIHRSIYEWFEISCDRFGRTPTRHQTRIAQSIFHKLKQNGYLVENEMQQLYSEAMGKFLADRLIIGTCPKCGFEEARGDQCDQCQTLLNPTELLNPKCKLSGTTPVMKTTRHIFLDLPKCVESLQSYVEETSKLGGWSSNCLQITQAWIRDGLKQRCITRDLKWGVPVPAPGYENKVFYVWFDAPIGYISITADYTSEWEQWWFNPKEVEMVQFMGKDNVPFHTVIFPTTLMGTRDPWTMMKKISVTEYLNYESGKFSKSRGVGVFGDSARDSGIPVEIWRYYLLSNRPEQQDTTFAWGNLGAQNNSELLNNLGNFVNRALKFVERFYESKIPNATQKGLESCSEFGSQCRARVESYVEKMEAIQIRAALSIVLEISAIGNKFLQDHKPWELIKNDPEMCQTIVRAGAGMVKVLAALLQPFMPSITKKILHQLNLEWESSIRLTQSEIETIQNPCELLPIDHRINEPVPLFTKITDEDIETFRQQFKGKQDDVSVPSKKRNFKKTDVASEDKKPEKAKSAEKASKPKTAEKKKEAEVVDVRRLDLRVGFINKAWKHPDADALYVEEIDVGEAEPRTVVSGLVKHIPEEEMQKQFVVLICNMKPVKMRGIESKAMVLAATAPDGSKVELVQPPEGSVAGDNVYVPGFEGEPDLVLNPKKKVFESIQPDLMTNSESVACYKDVPLTTSKGVCGVKSIKGGSIK